MDFNISKVELTDIQSLRQLRLAETNFQFVYNKCHGAGWADVYVFKFNELSIGYGSVWGKDKREDRDTIFEFFLIQPFKKYARQIFTKFVETAGTISVICQTNDNLLSSMMFELVKNINTEAILFENAFETAFDIPGALFIKSESPTEGTSYSIQKDGETVATGGYVWNYNFPFIDIYYEVKEGFRKQGYASFFTQELKKEAYHLGRVPSARCNVNNEASRATLLKAGMQICGYMISGETAIGNQ